MKRQTSLKDCPKCGIRARCVDTRAVNDGRIRRRYACACKHRWSSIETLLPKTAKFASIKLADALLRDSVRAELQVELRKLLGIEVRLPIQVRRKRSFKGVDIDAIHRKRA